MLRNVQALPTVFLTETQRLGEVRKQRSNKFQVASSHTNRNPMGQRNGMTTKRLPLHIPARSRPLILSICVSPGLSFRQTRTGSPVRAQNYHAEWTTRFKAVRAAQIALFHRFRRLFVSACGSSPPPALLSVPAAAALADTGCCGG